MLGLRSHRVYTAGCPWIRLSKLSLNSDSSNVSTGCLNPDWRSDLRGTLKLLNTPCMYTCIIIIERRVGYQVISIKDSLNPLTKPNALPPCFAHVAASHWQSCVQWVTSTIGIPIHPGKDSPALPLQCLKSRN